MTDVLLDAREMHVVKIGCFGCVAFTLYEAAITLGDESLWICTLPRRSPTRWLYTLSKYFAVVVQISNSVATLYFHSKYPIVNDQICRKWFFFRAMAAQIMLLSVELILMVRVYALYFHSRRIAALLLFILLGERAMMGHAIKILLQYLEFSHACLITHAPRIATYVGSGGILTQVIIIILTFVQHNFAAREGWRRRAPVLSIMIRDGTIVFVVISTVLVVTMIYNAFRREVSCIVFSGFISIASSAGCRLIINMQKVLFAQPESDGIDTSTGYRLSSAIDVASESTTRDVLSVQ